LRIVLLAAPAIGTWWLVLATRLGHAGTLAGEALQLATPTPIVRQLTFGCRECPRDVEDRGRWEFTAFVPPNTCDGPVLDVDVALNIHHTWRGDISVLLQAPEWSRSPIRPHEELFQPLGADGDHFGSGEVVARYPDRYLVLDDDIGVDLGNGVCSRPTANCWGRFRTPRRTLEREFYGSGSPVAAEGVWSLRIVDGAELDFAKVRDWRLTIRCRQPTTPTAVPPPSATPTPTVTPTSTATPRHTATRRPPTDPPPTALPTASSTPAPILLPFVLRDRPCPPQDVFTDVILLTDASTSMEERLTPSGVRKLDAALSAAAVFINGFLDPTPRYYGGMLLPPRQDQVGVVMFNRAAYVPQVLTANRARLIEALDYARYTDFQSRLAVGIDEAIAQLTGAYARPGSLKAIVVLTDGMVNPDLPASVQAAAERARAAGIRIFAIGFGKTIDRALLTDVSQPPHGGQPYYFEAPGEQGLQDIYRLLQKRVPCPPFLYWPYREPSPTPESGGGHGSSARWRRLDDGPANRSP